MHVKEGDGMANSVNSDQTALLFLEQSDRDSHCLNRPICELRVIIVVFALKLSYIYFQL